MSNDSRALAMILDLNDQLRAERLKSDALRAELGEAHKRITELQKVVYMPGLYGEVLRFDGKGGYTVETRA